VLLMFISKSLEHACGKTQKKWAPGVYLSRKVGLKTVSTTCELGV
jgi:hypothetical protein